MEDSEQTGVQKNTFLIIEGNSGREEKGMKY